MKKILRAKISYQNQFELLRRKIINMITEMPDDDFVFVIEDEEHIKRSVKSKTLIGETLQIQDSPITVTVREDGVFLDDANESLIPKRSLNQLKKINKISKSTDIGQKIKSYQSKNILDDKIETYEEYLKESISQSDLSLLDKYYLDKVDFTITEHKYFMSSVSLRDFYDDEQWNDYTRPLDNDILPFIKCIKKYLELNNILLELIDDDMIHKFNYDVTEDVYSISIKLSNNIKECKVTFDTLDIIKNRINFIREYFNIDNDFYFVLDFK